VITFDQSAQFWVPTDSNTKGTCSLIALQIDSLCSPECKSVFHFLNPLFFFLACALLMLIFSAKIQSSVLNLKVCSSAVVSCVRRNCFLQEAIMNPPNACKLLMLFCDSSLVWVAEDEWEIRKIVLRCWWGVTCQGSQVMNIIKKSGPHLTLYTWKLHCCYTV
jgi:hypothetical protein